MPRVVFWMPPGCTCQIHMHRQPKQQSQCFPGRSLFVVLVVLTCLVSVTGGNKDTMNSFSRDGRISNSMDHLQQQAYDTESTEISEHGRKILTPNKKIRHMRGKYTVREEVIRRVASNHPCRLTSTPVKVTFPDMKTEVLVSFLGYKEPNLMFVNRCKGLCSSEAVGQVACIPTKRRWKKVNMQLKTQVLGSHDVREKFRELVLEEHEECACQCLTISAQHCPRPELFNNETCSCMCDSSHYRRDKLQCDYQGKSWDDKLCSCRDHDDSSSDLSTSLGHPQIGGNYPQYGKDISGYEEAQPPPEQGCQECLSCFPGVAAMPKSTSGDYITEHSWTAVGICSFFIGLFASTTFYYWRKSREMAKELEYEEDSSDGEDEYTSPAAVQQQVAMANAAQQAKYLEAVEQGSNSNSGSNLVKSCSMSELEAHNLLTEVQNGKHYMQEATNSLGRVPNHQNNGYGNVIIKRYLHQPVQHQNKPQLTYQPHQNQEEQQPLSLPNQQQQLQQQQQQQHVRGDDRRLQQQSGSSLTKKKAPAVVEEMQLQTRVCPGNSIPIATVSAAAPGKAASAPTNNGKPAGKKRRRKAKLTSLERRYADALADDIPKVYEEDFVDTNFDRTP